MALKPKLIAEIVKLLEQDLATLLRAVQVAHEAATHEESKAEDQYDTRGLEASYLASAQATRAEEIQKSILYFKNAELAQIRLLTVQTKGRTFDYLIARAGGGMSIALDGKTVRVLTPDSPLGSELADRKTGESVEIEIRGDSQLYKITAAE